MGYSRAVGDIFIFTWFIVPQVIWPIPMVTAKRLVILIQTFCAFISR